MTDHDDKLTRSYRSLAREEPGAALDTAILAASRRAAARPFASRRWAMPVSVAAVLVLALGVTLRMQQEQPGIEIDTPAGQRSLPAAPAAEPEVKPPLATQEAPHRDKASAPLEKRAAPAKPTMPARPQPMPRREVFESQDSLAPKAEPRPFADAPASPLAPPAATAPATANAQSSLSLGASGLVTPKERAAAANRLAAEPPAPRMKLEAAGAAPAAPSPVTQTERELERIARLRIEGRHGEADKALEEFRRKYPDFRIPEAMWERVKPR